MVAELVDLCLDRMRGQPQQPVTAVRVRFASTIPADVLHQAFEMLTRQTPLAGAALEAQPFDIVLDCPACAFNAALEHDDMLGGIAVCPRCGEPTALRHPAELELLEVVGHPPAPRQPTGDS